MAYMVAGASAFVAGWLRTRYRKDLARARTRLAAYSPLRAHLPAGTVEYAIVGDGIPVLEVHGIFGGFDQGLVVARPLLGNGFRIIAPSRFGYLGTPLPHNASPASQADAFAELLDHLAIKRAAVVAHSAGSPSAIQMALRHPERVTSLVLVVPAAPGPGPVAPPKPLTQALFKSDAVAWLFATFFPGVLPVGVPKGLPLSAQDRRELATTFATMLPATARKDGFLFDMYVSAPSINSGYPFDQISVPTLVVTAADDPLAFPENARRLALAIPKAGLFEVERGGHLLLGQAEVVGRKVREFIAARAADRLVAVSQ